MKEAAISNQKWVGVVVLLVAAVAIPLCAQQSKIYREGSAWVEEVTGTLPAGRELRVVTDLGSIQVEGTAPQVTYVIRKRAFAPTEDAARRQFDHFHTTATRMADRDTIEGHMLGSFNRFNVEFLVQVPRDLALVKLETHGGALTLSSLNGTVLGTTGGGAVKLDKLDGPVKITSAGGSLEGGNLGGDFTLSSGGGDVHIDNIRGQAHVSLGGGQVYIGTVKGATVDIGGGNIEVRKCDGDLRASTGGGNLYFGDVAGSLRANTQGGGVRLASAQGPVQVTTSGGGVELYNLNQSAQVDTGAGPITAQFVNARGFSESSLRTSSGNVTVFMPGDLPVTVHAASEMAQGDGILSEFPALKITSTSKYCPKAMYAEGALNGGGPVLRVRTSIGQIAFRRSH